VAVVQLKDCAPPPAKSDAPVSIVAARPPSVITRYVRTQVLSFRNMWRENAAYGAFEIGRTTVRHIRRSHDRALSVHQMPPTPPSDITTALADADPVASAIGN
jgi:hypothetical protein